MKNSSSGDTAVETSRVLWEHEEMAPNSMWAVQEELS